MACLSVFRVEPRRNRTGDPILTAVPHRSSLGIRAGDAVALDVVSAVGAHRTCVVEAVGVGVAEWIPPYSRDNPVSPVAVKLDQPSWVNRDAQGERRRSCRLRYDSPHTRQRAPVPSAALRSCGLGVVLALSWMFRGPGLLVVWLGVLRLGAVWLGARRLEALTVGLNPILAAGRAG